MTDSIQQADVADKRGRLSQSDAAAGPVVVVGGRRQQPIRSQQSRNEGQRDQI